MPAFGLPAAILLAFSSFMDSSFKLSGPQYMLQIYPRAESLVQVSFGSLCACWPGIGMLYGALKNAVK